MTTKDFPNIVSSFRFFMMPAGIYLALNGKNELFFITLISMQLTDFLDGFLARKLDAQSELGSKLDILGDSCSYLTGAVGLFVFLPDSLNGFSLLLISLFSLSYLLRFLVSKSILNIWVYSVNHVTGKITFYCQSVLILSMYLSWDITHWILYVALISGLTESFYYIISVLDEKQRRGGIESGHSCL
ncbi:CDP-alcohol phosphatidyltransferase family protein [Alginatibacterium sediminis]|uniref:CDP-alcohol phosphatidyltransferase family protein n=1 Tax=Alginatibacterium sediminis TaxID=2164068 RepID=A0A420EI87_9ALTE|nr:CDP-alcohol phosphatidyltransferase family protein [Alginatibacterium sediminis]RKF20367.1 CDP-alcohol phosphatidyltransferase family protein [Alginatibacterium sediminis]